MAGRTARVRPAPDDIGRLAMRRHDPRHILGADLGQVGQKDDKARGILRRRRLYRRARGGRRHRQPSRLGALSRSGGAGRAGLVLVAADPRRLGAHHRVIRDLSPGRAVSERGARGADRAGRVRYPPPLPRRHPCRRPGFPRRRARKRAGEYGRAPQFAYNRH